MTKKLLKNQKFNVLDLKKLEANDIPIGNEVACL